MSSITRHLVATAGPDHTLHLSFTWNSADPFAVVMDLFTRDGQSSSWEFGWELLEDGLHGPAGVMDIRICPLSATVTEIVLCPPGPTQLALQVATADLASFLADTWIADPPPIPDCLDDIDFGEIPS